MLTTDERFAMEMAKLYRQKGFNPIPSEIDRKKPIYKFAEKYGWETPFPDEWLTEESWEKNPTTNIQVVTGRAWRLLVIDLDGDEARYTWKQWGRCPDTWTTHREEGASWHLWFRLPKGHPTPLPKGFLWKGDGKHEAVERLCDRSLIVAPPSFHVEHKRCQYSFLGKKLSPEKMAIPADCPRWLLDRKPIDTRPEVPAFVPPPIRPRDAARMAEGRLDREAILDGIYDKVGVARSWGLKFTGHVSPDGWAECHAFTRPDDRPSAAMHVRTGIYTDRGECLTLSYPDLMCHLGHAHDWRDAIQRLADRR